MNSSVLEEQETTINFYPRKIDERAEIYSSDPVMIRKIEKLSKNSPEEVVIIKEDDVSIQASLPRDWIKISHPRKVSMSEEQRLASAERLRKAREAKKT